MVLMDVVEREDGSRELVYRKTCPWKDVSEITYRLVQYYRFFDKGVLLCSGGLNDQPAWYIEAMVYIEGRMNHWQRVEADRSREEAESKSRSKFKR